MAKTECDCNHLQKLQQIAGVLRKYFECNDKGMLNPEYDEYYSPFDAIDEIHAIVGDI